MDLIPESARFLTLPRLLVGLLVLVPLLVTQLRGSDAPTDEVRTSAVEAVSETPAEEGDYALAQPADRARAELDQILLSESASAPVVERRVAPQRASRSARTGQAASKAKTTTTVKKAPAKKPAPKPAGKAAAKPSTAAAKPAATSAPAPSGSTQSGIASWYEAAPAGTCAHRSLPKGTMVSVTNLANGKRTTCRVADRGPYVDGYIIDLSKSNFMELAPLDDGIIRVTIAW